MAFPTRVNIVSGTEASASTHQVTLPTYQAGDKLVLVFNTTSAGDISSIDQSYTEVFIGNGSGVSTGIWWKEASASETAPTVTLLANDSGWWYMYSMRNTASGGPVTNATPQIYQSSSQNDVIDYPAVTFSGDAEVHLCGTFQPNSGSVTIDTAPTGTQVVDVSGNDNTTMYAYTASSSVSADQLATTAKNNRSIGATLVWLGAAAGTTVNMTSVALTMTDNNMTLDIARDVDMSSVALTMTANNMEVATGTVVNMASVALTMTPNNLQVVGNTTISMTSASIAPIVNAMTVDIARDVDMTSVALTMTPNNMTLTLGLDLNMSIVNLTMTDNNMVVELSVQGFDLIDCYAPNSDTLVGDFSDWKVAVFDKFPDGTETMTYYTTAQASSGGDFTISNVNIGPLDAVVYYMIYKQTGTEYESFGGWATLVDKT